MGRIQSATGLITGVPIQQTVDQLMALAARPRDRLLERTAALKQEQAALAELTALTLSVQGAASRLGDGQLFGKVAASSSDEGLVTAETTGDAAPGRLQVTPVRLSSAHQLISGGVASLEQPLPAGELTIAFGGFLDRSLELDLLNGASGVQRGVLRITDRSGAVADVDLTPAQTVDDVIQAVNRASGIRVRLSVRGDRFVLEDLSGGAGRLRVDDVAGGTTAADLGLAGLDTAASTAVGADVVRLGPATPLASLADGAGVRLTPGVPELEVTFRDNSPPLQIDLAAGDRPEATLGELLAAINAADPARLAARISRDGKRLELLDLTGDGGGVFAVRSINGSGAAEQLGLEGQAAGGLLRGRRLAAPLRGPLLASLRGGAGLGPLGLLELTDRSGGSAAVDLSGAETLQEVIDAINAAGVGIAARVNPARNGLLLLDTSGGDGALVVASGDGTNTAEQLGLAVNAAQDAVDGGPLQLRYVHPTTPLASLNQGRGVAPGSFLIRDSLGASGAVNLTLADAETLGDVIDLINSLGLAVQARMNDTGDGLLLVDTGGGQEQLTVTQVSNATTVADLGLDRPVVVTEQGGAPVQQIDGAATRRVALDGQMTLEDLAQAINASGAGVSAAVVDTGGGAGRYRLWLSSGAAGRAGETLVDGSAAGLTFYEAAPAQDALAVVGGGPAGGGVVAASPSNQFDQLWPGARITLEQAAGTPVTVRFERTADAAADALRTLAEQYNKLRDKLDELTFYNAEDNTAGPLFGAREALRLEMDLASVFSGRVQGAGRFHSFEELGLALNDQGRLEFDEQRFRDRYAEDPEAVEAFFATDGLGAADRVDAAAEGLVGEGHSVLLTRTETLQRRIEDNDRRVAALEARLEQERLRLLKQFYAMEQAVGALRTQMSALAAIQQLPSLVAAGQADQG